MAKELLKEKIVNSHTLRAMKSPKKNLILRLTSFAAPTATARDVHSVFPSSPVVVYS